jgi:trigger factor
MEVSVENTGKLERRMRVQLPAEQIDQQVQAKLEQLTRTMRLDGFRPGKVPLSVVARRYGARVRDEATGELIASSYEAALAQEKLQPASDPEIEKTADHPGEAFEYIATFEIYPDVVLPSLDEMAIERPVAEVTDDDLDRMMEKLRRQRMTWTDVDRAASNGDRVIIDFHGTIDGEEFSGNKAGQVPLELGSGSMIPGFEDQLLGASAGETRTLNVTFPENYGSKAVAGKDAQFEVRVASVAESVLPELDDDLAKTFGVEDLAALRREVRTNMERELNAAIRARTKDLVFDKLLEKVDLEVPSSLVKNEVDALVKNANSTAEKLAGDKGRAEQEARRRVALGLLVGEIVKANQLPLDEAKVRETIESIAASYEKPEEVVGWYYKNPEMLEGIKTFVMEAVVVEWIVGKIKVTDKTVSFDELINS